MKSLQPGIRFTLTGLTLPPRMRRRLASREAETRSYWLPPPWRTSVTILARVGLDGGRALGPPREAHGAAAPLRAVALRRLQVLAHDGERPAVAQVDDETRHRPQVHDLAHRSGLLRPAGGHRLSVVE